QAERRGHRTRPRQGRARYHRRDLQARGASRRALHAGILHDARRLMAKDPRVEAAIAHWAPRFVANGVPLADFQEVTAGCERWEDWCELWSARAAIHEELGARALAEGYALSA